MRGAAIFEKIEVMNYRGSTSIELDRIGLFITEHIIKAHHGKIWAESEGENKGSTFFIELPVG